MAILVSQMGEVYRVNKRNYKRLMRVLADGFQPVMSQYGKSLGVIEQDVTDLSAEDANDILEELK